MEWKKVKISDIATLINGRAYAQPELLYEGKYKIVRVGNLSGGDNWFFSNMELGEDKYCNEGDLLYAWACNFGPYIWHGDKTIFHYHIWKMILNESLANKTYLYYYLKYITPYWLGNVNGSVMVHITKGTMEKQEFPLPPIETQRRIAAILSSLDDKIENNNRINRNLEAQAQALFKSWFVDFEPFGGVMPEDWREGSIYDYIDVIYGAPYKSSLFNVNNEGLPLIRIRDLKTNSPQVSTPEILPNTEYIEAGDIVAGMDAEFTPYLWQGERGLLNQRCCKFKVKDSSISNYYVLFLVKPELEYVQSYKTGTTVSHLGKADIDRFNVVVPPIEIVRAFSERVDAMKERVVSNAQESARLATLRDTLLPKLMKGEIEL